ncbi:sensor histidine kinase [Dolosicoccus paucivorans]|uniref:Sensor histidine kinase n=1 Tax=Dolosicoccus paucivorans TaxID=84521 RepID=A0A1G8JAJ0_9LACT|nr:sensor histidine kinase [Dolosicoccus paucivorans]PMB84580.1 sensor histidine kinase [Dolosicoccus paucivorans]PMC58145.1 sensor histidine kinase [Dolosicoccus paucivorans]SDI28102.1 two-component system, NarL family, sensor histidine kinase LiaS [Dolosicoccus paucivorans]
MNLKFWFQIFIQHCVVLFGLTFSLIYFLGKGLSLFDPTQLWQIRFFHLPFSLILTLLIISIALVTATFTLSQAVHPYETIRAQLNWLMLGQYDHPIFTNPPTKRAWDLSEEMTHDIGLLKDKMQQMAFDLQEFSAAPTFVGEDTREEIIEQERTRIARELHDSVSQQLFAAMMLLATLNEQTDEEEQYDAIKPMLETTSTIVDQAQAEMRALLLHLRPVELQGKSLKEGITQLLQELDGRLPIKIHWDIVEVRLETGVEDHLFRIVQEAISNTLRHAKASELEVLMRKVGSQLELSIQDNGVGFDTSKTFMASHGLNNIKERVESLGGDFKVTSQKGEGTVIKLSIPFQER